MCDIEPEKKKKKKKKNLFAGMSVHFEPGTLTGWAVKGLTCVQTLMMHATAHGTGAF